MVVVGGKIFYFYWYFNGNKKRAHTHWRRSIEIFVGVKFDYLSYTNSKQIFSVYHKIISFFGGLMLVLEGLSPSSSSLLPPMRTPFVSCTNFQRCSDARAKMTKKKICIYIFFLNNNRRSFVDFK